MTTEHVIEDLDRIKKYAISNPKMARGLEEVLLKDVLKAIANGNCECPEELAAEALKVDDIEYKM